MKTNHLLLTAEIISFFTTILLFFKTFVFQPECFTLFDGFVTILPLFFIKIVEIKIIFFDQ